MASTLFSASNKLVNCSIGAIKDRAISLGTLDKQSDAEASQTINIKASIDRSVENSIQGDSVVFDIEYSLEQENNRT